MLLRDAGSVLAEGFNPASPRARCRRYQPRWRKVKVACYGVVAAGTLPTTKCLGCLPGTLEVHYPLPAARQMQRGVAECNTRWAQCLRKIRKIKALYHQRCRSTRLFTLSARSIGRMASVHFEVADAVLRTRSTTEEELSHQTYRDWQNRTYSLR